MADITSTVAEKPVGRSGESLGYWVSKKITPVDDGVTTVAAHNIFTIPANSFVAEGYVVFTTAVTSGGAATIKFGNATLDYCGALAKANCAVGDIFALSINDQDATDSGVGYSTSADTFDMTVGTAALTAGAFTVAIRIVDLISE
jgi:predicted RNA-binding protein with TRAM domain